MHNYKILKEASDIKDHLLEKDNLTAEFTIRAIEENIAELEKFEKELKANISLQKAAMENIANNHPGILGLSDQLKIAAAMYSESDQKQREYKTKLKDVRAVLKREKAQIDEVYEALGFEKSDYGQKDKGGN